MKSMLKRVVLALADRKKWCAPQHVLTMKCLMSEALRSALCRMGVSEKQRAPTIKWYTLRVSAEEITTISLWFKQTMLSTWVKIRKCTVKLVASLHNSGMPLCLVLNIKWYTLWAFASAKTLHPQEFKV